MKQFISEHYGENAEVIHKVWKRGKIESISDGIATIFFDKLSDRKRLEILQSIKTAYYLVLTVLLQNRRSYLFRSYLKKPESTVNITKRLKVIQSIQLILNKIKNGKEDIQLILFAVYYIFRVS